jgi:antitoxin component YwqK of YwqJK toxin-antitoxin module
MVKISGKVSSADNVMLINTVVVNQRTFLGIGADINGAFSVQALRTDTLIISAHGHETKKICFKDSVKKAEYRIRISLKQLSVNLPTVSIEGEKSMQQIKKDISELGVKDTRMTQSPVDALQSPITYLYERFSKFEQSKRKVAELENDYRKREVLKNLFRIYIRYDIIELSETEFEQFISYCNLSEVFIKTATEFELVSAIKNRYENFSKLAKGKVDVHSPVQTAISFERTGDGIYEMVVPGYDSLSNTDNAFQDYYYNTENKPDGKLIVKNEFGKVVRECYYRDGKMGEEQWWYSTGEKEWHADWGFENKLRVYTGWYRNGQKRSEQDSTGANYHWYESGQLKKMIRPLSVGVKCTYISTWYPNGKPEEEGMECDKKKSGPWKYYNADGILKEEKTF